MSPKEAVKKATMLPTTILGKWPMGIRRHGNPGITSKDAKRNQSVTFMTDRYTKLASAVPTSKTTASNITSLFLDSWAIPYGIPEIVLKDNRT